MGVVHGRVRVVSGNWRGESGEWYVGGVRVASGTWEGESGSWLKVVSSMLEG